MHCCFGPSHVTTFVRSGLHLSWRIDTYHQTHSITTKRATLTHGDFEMHWLAGGNHKIARSTRLACTDEAVSGLATTVMTIDTYSEDTSVACAIHDRGAVVARGTVVGCVLVPKVSLAPSAVEISWIRIAVARLREANLAVLLDSEGCRLTSLKRKFEECVAACAT